MSGHRQPEPRWDRAGLTADGTGPVAGPFGVIAEAPKASPEPQTRDAEGLTPALASVRAVLKREGAQSIDTAPRGSEEPLLLFCPDQGGWHVGRWHTGCEPACWVAAIDEATILQPTHWDQAPPEPE